MFSVSRRIKRTTIQRANPSLAVVGPLLLLSKHPRSKLRLISPELGLEHSYLRYSDIFAIYDNCENQQETLRALGRRCEPCLGCLDSPRLEVTVNGSNVVLGRERRGRRRRFVQGDRGQHGTELNFELHHQRQSEWQM